MTFTFTEVLLLAIVVILMFDRWLHRKDRSRLNELEKNERDRQTSARVYSTPVDQLVERANVRWLKREKPGDDFK